jgi:hypothetical protein
LTAFCLIALVQGSKTDFKSLFFLINIYFQEAFSQSDFQKGPELNKQIYNEDSIKIQYMIILSIEIISKLHIHIFQF